MVSFAPSLFIQLWSPLLSKYRGQHCGMREETRGGRERSFLPSLLSPLSLPESVFMALPLSPWCRLLLRFSHRGKNKEGKKGIFWRWRETSHVWVDDGCYAMCVGVRKGQDSQAFLHFFLSFFGMWQFLVICTVHFVIATSMYVFSFRVRRTTFWLFWLFS